MRKEARVVQTRILQLESGVPPTGSNSKNARKELRIMNIVIDYENRSFDYYLRSIAVNLVPF